MPLRVFCEEVKEDGNATVATVADAIAAKEEGFCSNSARELERERNWAGLKPKSKRLDKAPRLSKALPQSIAP